MKKNGIQSVKVVILAIVLSVVTAMAWTGPTQPPPNGNAEAPINVSSASQEKGGYLSIGKNSQNPNSSLEVWRNATEGGVIWGGALGLSGGAIVDSYVRVNGNNLPTKTLPLEVTGESLLDGFTSVTGTLMNSKLASVNNPGTIVYPAPVCADASGHLMLCGTVPSPGSVGLFETSIYGSWSLDIVPISTNLNPGLGSTVTVELWGAGGGGGGGASQSNAGGGGGGGGGQSGAYIKTTHTINGSTPSPLVGVVGKYGSGGYNSTSGSGSDGGDTTLTMNGDSITAYGGSKGKSLTANPVGSNGGSSGNTMKGHYLNNLSSYFTTITGANGKNGSKGEDGQNCSSGAGGAGGGANFGFGSGGKGGRGGHHHAGIGGCSGGDNWDIENGTNGTNGRVKITWTATP